MPPSEDEKDWNYQVIGLGNLIAKEGKILAHVKEQKEWAKEQMEKLAAKKGNLLDLMREQGKWNKEQMDQDWYPRVVNLFAEHRRAVDELVVVWQQSYDELVNEMMEI